MKQTEQTGCGCMWLSRSPPAVDVTPAAHGLFVYLRLQIKTAKLSVAATLLYTPIDSLSPSVRLPFVPCIISSRRYRGICMLAQPTVASPYHFRPQRLPYLDGKARILARHSFVLRFV